MLNYSHTDILSTLEVSKNINAAVKKFLKNDVGNDPKKEKFIKNLRQILASKDAVAKQAFIAKQLPEFEVQLLVLGRYAFLEQVDSIADEVIEIYAEEFNATYVKNGNGLQITNVDRFNQIVSEVDGLISERLIKQDLPSSNFMKNVLFFDIFEGDVLKSVIPLVQTGQ